MIDCKTDQPGEFASTIQIGSHTLRTDMGVAAGGKDTGPDAHDYFDASLAACKALTAMWYARKNKIALERVETHVERDESQERAGKYVLKVRVAFHGPLTEDDRTRLYATVSRCPVHKLMTTTEIVIETAPL